MIYLAFELDNKNWKLALSNGEKFRYRTVNAGDLPAVLAELSRVRSKWGDCPVCSVYEAGRDGFWLHRWLETQSIANTVVDPASIEVNRKMRRTKTDRLDARALVRQLMRARNGERGVWSELRIPSESEEDERRGEREIKRVKNEMTSLSNRIKGLLALHGIKLRGSLPKLGEIIEAQTKWDGQQLPTRLCDEIKRACARLELARQQLRELEAERRERLKTPCTKADKLAACLASFCGIGPVSAMTLAQEFFAWREFKNIRQVGASAGLAGTPYQSGSSNHEQGISKAGNSRVRTLMVELAWCWLRHQPDSALSIWFNQRYGLGSSRSRRIGIVATARKLLVALWKYLNQGELPEGAKLKMNSVELAAT